MSAHPSTNEIKRLEPGDDYYPGLRHRSVKEVASDDTVKILGLTEDVGDCEMCGEPLEKEMSDDCEVYMYADSDCHNGVGYMCTACYEDLEAACDDSDEDE